MTLRAYVFYAERPGWQRYLPLFISFTLGLMTKPMIVTLPCALLLLDYWPLGRSAPFRRLVMEKLPLFAVSAGAGVLAYRTQWTGGGVKILDYYTLLYNAGNALQAYVGYLKKTFWPADLAVLYPFDAAGVTGLRTVGAAFVLLAITLVAVMRRKKSPYLIMGWLWYLGTLVPVIGILRVGYQSMADRYTYLPHIGLFIMVIWGVSDLAEQSALVKRLASGTAIIAMGGMMAVTFLQVKHWRDTITLMEHAIKVTDNNWLAYSNLGAAYILIGTQDRRFNISASLPLEPDTPERRTAYLERAVAVCTESLRIRPGYLKAYNNLKVASALLGRP